MGKTISLSHRLLALAQMVTPGSVVWDVGCDHGYLSIYLVQNGISPRVVAMDVRVGPLQAAKKHIDEYGLSSYIETRLSDGLSTPGTLAADTILIAGMGCGLIIRILSEGRSHAQAAREVIVQPQSQLPLFRCFLRKEGYRIVKENIIEEGGLFYFPMKIRYTGEEIPCQNPLFDQYGEGLMRERSDVFLRYLVQKAKTLSQVLTTLQDQEGERAALRKKEMEGELAILERLIVSGDDSGVSVAPRSQMGGRWLQ
ncbi:MAG: class I SAM-dependent methyltransferase [Lachnospiraceae bacterium]|jgi:tRNA (adenine22-N1)-methyltransferase|nr:class I SAM-dependent methyltransferase [Lachnospiraceae bacterium]